MSTLGSVMTPVWVCTIWEAGSQTCEAEVVVSSSSYTWQTVLYQCHAQQGRVRFLLVLWLATLALWLSCCAVTQAKVVVELLPHLTFLALQVSWVFFVLYNCFSVVLLNLQIVCLVLGFCLFTYVSSVRVDACLCHFAQPIYQPKYSTNSSILLYLILATRLVVLALAVIPGSHCSFLALFSRLIVHVH